MLRSVTRRSEPWTPAFGKLIGDAIETSPLGIGEIAEKSGMTTTAIRAIRDGRLGGKSYGGKPSTVADLAHVLGVTPRQLIRTHHPLAAKAMDVHRKLAGRPSRDAERLALLATHVDAMRAILADMAKDD